MNVATGHAGSWSAILWLSSALRSLFGEPALQHPGREAPPLEKPTWPRPEACTQGSASKPPPHPPPSPPKHPGPAFPPRSHGTVLRLGPAFSRVAAPSQALTATPSLPRSRTATCTCTCAGRTTPTCRVPCTRRTARPASSWAQVGGRRSRTARAELQSRGDLTVTGLGPHCVHWASARASPGSPGLLAPPPEGCLCGPEWARDRC